MCTYSAQQLTAGSTTNLVLNTINGLISYVYLIVRSSLSFTNDAFLTFADLSGSQIAFLNNSGQNKLISTTYPVDILRGAMSSEHFSPGPLSFYMPIYAVAFGNALNAYKEGILDGYLPFNSQDQIQLQISPSFTTGLYFVHLFSRVYRHACQNNGIFEVNES